MINEEIYTRSQDSIAQEALTNSKRPSCFVKGVYPTHVDGGDGVYLYADGKDYIDMIAGLGSCLFGYGHPIINRAIIDQLSTGTSYSLSSKLEVELAEKLKTVLPWCEQFKFLKTGSEACTAALRIARAYTGRELVLTEGYHGWHDEFVSLEEPALGVTGSFKIKKLANDDGSEVPAAVIIEPILLEHDKKRIDELRQLADKCAKTHTILIFDETITGLRYPNMSVSSYYGIKPDLIIMGKALGGGLPLYLVGGKKKVMSCDEYFVSSTFAGETASMAACSKIIDLLKSTDRDDYGYDLNRLWNKGRSFHLILNSHLERVGLHYKGYPTRSRIQGSDVNQALFFQEMCRAGLLFGPTLFFGFQHIDYSVEILNTVKDVSIRLMTMNESDLLGEMPRSPFAERVRK